MSREELVGAYVDGRVSRRVFIRSLVALGVTAGAAVTYADALSAQTPPRVTQATDIYSTTTTTTTATSTTSPSSTTTVAVGADQAEQDPAADPSQVSPRFTG